MEIRPCLPRESDVEVTYTLWDQEVQAEKMYRECTGDASFSLVPHTVRAKWLALAKEVLLRKQKSEEANEEAEFKVGDRVVLAVDNQYLKEYHGGEPGTIGVIQGGLSKAGREGPKDTYMVKWGSAESSVRCSTDEFRRVKKTSESNFQRRMESVLQDIKDLLLEKNESYGNSALDPINVFSKATPMEQLKVRVDDKLNRLYHGKEYGQEDTVTDLIGYLVLMKTAEREQTND